PPRLAPGPCGPAGKRKAAPALLVVPAEQRDGAVLPVALTAAAVLDRLVDRREQARAARGNRPVGERVERPGLDEAFDRPLVDQPLIHLFAKAEERVDPPLVPADAEHPEHRAFADVLDGAEPEAHARL